MDNITITQGSAPGFYSFGRRSFKSLDSALKAARKIQKKEPFMKIIIVEEKATYMTDAAWYVGSIR